VSKCQTLRVTQRFADFLLLDEHERGPSDDLRLQLEAVSQFPEEERKIVKALLDGMIIKHQTKQMVGNLSQRAPAFQRLKRRSHSHPGHRREWHFVFRRKICNGSGA
jgi:hypothetical protein